MPSTLNNAKSLPKCQLTACYNIRLQLSRELRDLEGRARKLAAELHQETYPASSEIASMKQDIEQLRACNNAHRDRFYFD